MQCLNDEGSTSMLGYRGGSLCFSIVFLEVVAELTFTNFLESCG